MQIPKIVFVYLAIIIVLLAQVLMKINANLVKEFHLSVKVPVSILVLLDSTMKLLTRLVAIVILLVKLVKELVILTVPPVIRGLFYRVISAYQYVLMELFRLIINVLIVNKPVNYAMDNQLLNVRNVTPDSFYSMVKMYVPIHVL